jgi:hypothetical protein
LDQIEKMNQTAFRLSEDTNLTDIFKLPETTDPSFLKKEFNKLRETVRTYKRFDHGSNPVPQSFYEKMFSKFETENLSGHPLLYGVITTKTNVREFPTDEVSLEGPFDTEFDYFQYSSLEFGTPAVIHLYTKDRSWCFVQSYFVKGWVRSTDIAIGTRETVKRFAEAKPLVVTGKKAKLYADKNFQAFVSRLQMGVTLPFQSQTASYYQVEMPYRVYDGSLGFAAGFLRPGEDVRAGYLPYTQENVFKQAFKFLGTPYGWGGMFQSIDCSQFIQSVFATFGFQLPRNSLHQAYFNLKEQDNISDLDPAEKLKELERYQNRPTLLYLKGHIMLFLGFVEGRPYAIHSTWAYRKPGLSKDQVVYIGKNVVSDLSLGQGSRKGSLLERLLDLVPLD